MDNNIQKRKNNMTTAIMKTTTKKKNAKTNVISWDECVSMGYTDMQVFQDVHELTSVNYTEDRLYTYLKNQVSEGNFETLAESLQTMVEYKRLYTSYKKFGKNEYIKKDLKRFPEMLDVEVAFLRATYYEEKTGEKIESEE